MNLMTHDLVRAQMTARRAEADHLRPGAHLAQARRTNRKAEKTAQRARLAHGRTR